MRLRVQAAHGEKVSGKEPAFFPGINQETAERPPSAGFFAFGAAGRGGAISRGLDYSPPMPLNGAELSQRGARGLRRSCADLEAFLRILASAAAAGRGRGREGPEAGWRGVG